ncbi:LacI family DNA-binding transcriptional regulator [Gordonia malaquae]|uniref:LacI family DNA-binding transcriptional regulator n=1 Tax=Gordonia malaquae TaxID=410332 RepID=UPI0030FED947
MNSSQPHTRATSADVAQHAKVSRTTVSLVLNGNDATISEATRDRVLASARALDYIPNPLARSLRSKSSNLVLVPAAGYTDSDTVNNFVFALRAQLETHGLVLAYDGDGSGSDDDLVRRWSERRPWMVVSTPATVTPALADRLRKQGIAQVVLFSDGPVDYASTAILDTSIGAAAANYLVKELGHRHISIPVPSGTRPIDYAGQRLAEFATAAAGLDIEVRREEVASTRDGFARLVRQWLTQGQLPTAVYAYSDTYALAVIDALRVKGISVPTEVSVVGTDNSLLSRLTTPALTSVSSDIGSAVTHLAERIAELHANASTANTVLHINPDIQIHTRESSGRPRI